MAPIGHQARLCARNGSAEVKPRQIRRRVKLGQNGITVRDANGEIPIVEIGGPAQGDGWPDQRDYIGRAGRT